MNHRKPLERPYPEDLDKDVAAVVFGYKVGEGYYYRDPASGHDLRIRKYSTDHNCAFDVLVQMMHLGYGHELSGIPGEGFTIKFTKGRKVVAEFSSSEMPRGICLAALAALKA